MVYLPTLIPSKSTSHVVKYTVRPMDPLGMNHHEYGTTCWLVVVIGTS